MWPDVAGSSGYVILRFVLPVLKGFIGSRGSLADPEDEDGTLSHYVKAGCGRICPNTLPSLGSRSPAVGRGWPFSAAFH